MVGWRRSGWDVVLDKWELLGGVVQVTVLSFSSPYLFSPISDVFCGIVVVSGRCHH